MKRAAFLKSMQHGNEGRELNARMRHTAITLRSYLPTDYRKAVHVLKDLAPRMPKGYTALLYPDFVGVHGLDEPAFSLEALRYFTPFGSSEFAVREFFRRDTQGTLKVMRAWAEDDDEHVRRLASEGSRPRLPWSFRLEAVVKDPSLTTPMMRSTSASPWPTTSTTSARTTRRTWWNCLTAGTESIRTPRGSPSTPAAH